MTLEQPNGSAVLGLMGPVIKEIKRSYYLLNSLKITPAKSMTYEFDNSNGNVLLERTHEIKHICLKFAARPENVELYRNGEAK